MKKTAAQIREERLKLRRDYYIEIYFFEALVDRWLAGPPRAIKRFFTGIARRIMLWMTAKTARIKCGPE